MDLCGLVLAVEAVSSEPFSAEFPVPGNFAGKSDGLAQRPLRISSQVAPSASVARLAAGNWFTPHINREVLGSYQG